MEGDKGEALPAVQFLDVTGGLQKDDRRYGSVVLLHPQAIKAWHSVLNQGLNGLGHLLVTGTPGIGKSRSMTYLLWLLMQRGETVFYEARKEKALYAFAPCTAHDGGATIGSAGYEVWMWVGSDYGPNAGLIPAMSDPTTWRLVDPAKAA